jgi:hypothetical protein
LGEIVRELLIGRMMKKSAKLELHLL